MIIKRIKVLKFALFDGVLMAIFGLLVGLLFFMIDSMSNMSGHAAAGAFWFMGGIWVVILMPIFYGILGFIGGAIGALIYNLVARVIGGIEIEME